MRRIYFIAVIFIIFVSCSKENSYTASKTAGSSRPAWFEPPPYGMVYIPRGSFHMGAIEEELQQENRSRMVTVESFWMDDTEITNSEYKQYVHWVCDSIARKILGQVYPDYLITEDKNGVPLDNPILNRKPRINWKNADIRNTLSEMYIPEQERFGGRLEIDPRKLIYEYYWIDYQQAARRSNSYDFETESYTGMVINSNGEETPIANRSSFIIHEVVPVYPDTLCWIRDFTYSYNEPITYKYFSHPGFADYPVVGVSWKQAKAFCDWRTRFEENYRSRMNDIPAHNYRLPTEAEWEYAAYGGHQGTVYPWGSYYTRDQKGCFVANFKPLRGNYVADQEARATTTKVGTYDPNGYGLYDMAGNVAEWTQSAYFEAGYDLMNDMNPMVEYRALPDDPPVMKRKVIRGGSFKDISYFLRNGTRSFEYQDTTKSYVGFRCVRTSFRNEFQDF
ncbi:MAG: SUMF1/EgtB/PvdO family nonheme iron enzyme [Prolixibacteraceae bacterium]|nr:SUMF1/EgtB/PvdO family nonheme iron enzyme [Prolixibacteraceae bacterium]